MCRVLCFSFSCGSWKNWLKIALHRPCYLLFFLCNRRFENYKKVIKWLVSILYLKQCFKNGDVSKVMLFLNFHKQVPGGMSITRITECDGKTSCLGHSLQFGLYFGGSCYNFNIFTNISQCKGLDKRYHVALRITERISHVRKIKFAANGYVMVSCLH